MKQTLFWILAVVITIGSVFYQRLTGPTHPLRVEAELNEKEYSLRLTRSRADTTDAELEFNLPGNEVTGLLVYRRFPTNDPWDTLILQPNKNNLLSAMVSGQPPAGKIEYYLLLDNDDETLRVPTEGSVKMRFKGRVPAAIILPHVMFIFTAMLFSTLAGLFALGRLKRAQLYMKLAIVFLLLGGFVMGPIIQWMAFGDFWTGFPFGGDLTDNKVVIGLVFWLGALILNLKKERPWAIVVASVVFLGINLIPHSALGSEYNYETGEVVTGMILPFVFSQKKNPVR